MILQYFGLDDDLFLIEKTGNVALLLEKNVVMATEKGKSFNRRPEALRILVICSALAVMQN